jgi:alginate O-acetyltransferase complex protein AlgI
VAFVEMNIQLFVPLCKPWLGKNGTIFAVFLISGLLHEAAISFPVLDLNLAHLNLNQGWGSPMLYFLIQGVALFALEPFFKITSQPKWLRRLWTWAWILLPVPLLFHQPFRFVLILPLLDWLQGLLTQWTLYQWFDLAIVLAGIGHFCTLLAGTQLPLRLNWRDELAKVSSFNRKIFLNYYATVGLTIIGFGFLTLIFKNELLAGAHSALTLAALIALFWTMRVLVDFFYFKHEEWPEGFLFVAGHAALTTLFILMASVYWGLIYCFWVLGWHAL